MMAPQQCYLLATGRRVANETAAQQPLLTRPILPKATDGVKPFLV